MIFKTHTLSSSLLDQYIESIFYFKDHMPEHEIERVVPTGHIFMIFELDGMERQTFDNKTLLPNEAYKNVWVSGMHKHHLSISAHQNSSMLVIQFKPFGGFPFFHIPVHQYNNTVILIIIIIAAYINDLLKLYYVKNTQHSYGYSYVF